MDLGIGERLRLALGIKRRWIIGINVVDITENIHTISIGIMLMSCERNIAHVENTLTDNRPESSNFLFPGNVTSSPPAASPIPI
jgi:hypothetical protein